MRVDDVGEITLGKKREPSSHVGPHMRPYLRVANVQEDYIDTSDVYEMNFPPEDYDIYRLSYGDILLNEGQSPELVGRPAMYRDDVPGACFQMTLLRFRAYAGVSPAFALLVFRAYLRRGKFREASRWTTNIAHLSTRRFAAMPFPLPPLAEQERIAEEADRRLSTADRLAAAFIQISERIRHARFLALSASFCGADKDESPWGGESRQEPDAPHSEEGSSLPQRGTAMSAGSRGRRPLADVLASQESGIRPRELFERCGYKDEAVDDFYADLRSAVIAGKVHEERDVEGEPILVPAGVRR